MVRYAFWLSVAVSLLATPVLAGESNVDAEAKAGSPQSAAITDLSLADQLVQYGKARNNPLALIVAARIKKEISVKQDTSRKRESSEGEADADAKAGGATLETPEQILAAAKELASERPDVIALAQEVADMTGRGRVGGPGLTRDRVRARGSDSYRVSFRGRERAAVAVTGDHDTDLDLYVYDENGNIICSDTRPGDHAECHWTPRWTGSFVVKILNHGRVSNRYVLMTN